MSHHTAKLKTQAPPSSILASLTDPESCLLWSPVPLEIEHTSSARLHAGARAEVCGNLCGKAIGFTVEVRRADEERFELSAAGPFTIDVNYRLRREEIELDVVTSAPRGLGGRCLKSAGDALLAAGILRDALSRLERHALSGREMALA